MVEPRVESLLRTLSEGQRKLREELEGLKAGESKKGNGGKLTEVKSNETLTEKTDISAAGPYQKTTRFGALDKRLNESRRSWKTPRKSAGEAMICPGYDWVAGLLDTTPGVSQYSSEWLQELREFRQVNHSECYMPHNVLASSGDSNNDNRPFPCDNHVTEDEFDQTTPDVRSYFMSERLFPVPINCSCKSDILCPVCEDLLQPPNKSSQPPSLVQVSVPRSIIQVPYQPRPHRRISFNPTDSMGLSQHCLSGWHTSQTSAIPNYHSIALKSSLK